MLPRRSMQSHDRLEKCSMILDQITDTICYGDSVVPVEITLMLLTVARELRNLTDAEFEELQTYTEIRDKLLLMSSTSSV